MDVPAWPRKKGIGEALNEAGLMSVSHPTMANSPPFAPLPFRGGGERALGNVNHHAALPRPALYPARAGFTGAEQAYRMEHALFSRHRI